MSKEKQANRLNTMSPQEFQNEIQRLYEEVENQTNSEKKLTQETITAIKNALATFSKMNFVEKKYMLAYTTKITSSVETPQLFQGPFAALFMWPFILKHYPEIFMVRYHTNYNKLQFLEKALERK